MSREAVRRGKGAVEKARRSLSPSSGSSRSRSASPVTYTREYWGRGGVNYGYGARWVRRYPWAVSLVPFATWYVFPRWMPYYTLVPTYVVSDAPVPSNAFIVDRVNFPDTLPTLPTFAELGIDLTPLQLQRAESDLSAEERARIQTTMATIGVQLVALRRRMEVPDGYAIVPDLDTARFSWIRRA